MGNHRNTAARIWRTIVCSGAMLGAPLGAAADTPNQDAKPAPAKLSLDEQRTAALEREIAAIDVKLGDTSDSPRTEGQYKMKKIPADTSLGAQEQSKLMAERKALQDAAKLVGNKPPPDVLAAIDQLRNAKTDAQRTEARAAIRGSIEVNDLITRVNKAIEDVTNAQNDADRTAAQAKLKALQKELDAKKAEVAKRRPRAPERERPIGRGFILS
jgi:hypothetical protein